MFNQILRPIVRNVARNGITRSASAKATDIKLATINDIPAPSGPWKDHYDARQKVYNVQLIAGISALVATIAFIKVSGIIFFNFNPPVPPEESE